ncbi:HCL003Cp [Eremothecium sinecaudum]|uniref:Palmitoyltransferase PFA4 n=1 Tax=Eremothecium sinecaudum TaxID=45286 RepID=A0A120K219_9SACH|nr:HCL003Cp [Eremothecium sinecaudum]AMD20148.1 HCL003Cp [Eremothecium sinecaudum]
MVAKLRWKWLGIFIPCFLIAFIGYFAHYFILSKFLSLAKQIWFQVSLTMIWLSYYKAIYTNPGKPPEGFKPFDHEWRNYCDKCETFKPERTHHCKTCNQCVLVMDHHCPWTMNCVGYKTFPHFMRFLFWIVATTGFLSIQLGSRIAFVWQNRYSSGQFITKVELVFLTILTPLNGFVFITILVLFLRCVKNQIFKGMTQIESWEMDRIENLFYRKRLLPQLMYNLKILYPNSIMDWQQELDEMMSSNRIQIDDLINFPYDIEPFTNAINCMGPFSCWLNPFSEQEGNGVRFPKNDISIYDESSSITDQMLALPWPPDGGRELPSNNSEGNIEASTEDGERVIRKRHPQQKSNLSRKKWRNEWGESLEHFGVDIYTEE